MTAQRLTWPVCRCCGTVHIGLVMRLSNPASGYGNSIQFSFVLIDNGIESSIGLGWQNTFLIPNLKAYNDLLLYYLILHVYIKTIIVSSTIEKTTVKQFLVDDVNFLKRTIGVGGKLLSSQQTRHVFDDPKSPRGFSEV